MGALIVIKPDPAYLIEPFPKPKIITRPSYDKVNSENAYSVFLSKIALSSGHVWLGLPLAFSFSIFAASAFGFLSLSIAAFSSLVLSGGITFV